MLLDYCYRAARNARDDCNYFVWYNLSEEAKDPNTKSASKDRTSCGTQQPLNKATIR